MASYQTYKRTDVSKLIDHYDRSEKELRDRKNETIDKTRTKDNYSLLTDGKAALERYHSRLNDVYCYNRPDVNTLVDCVVTLPKDVPADRQKDFFKAVFNFLRKEHGAENMVAASVHLDETTPHLHFAFIPVVEDQKHNRLKVCAKEVINRLYLKQFHQRLRDAVEKDLGIPVGILNGATLGGNMTITEMKLAKKKEELQSVEADLAARKYELNLASRIGELVETFTPVKQQLEELERVLEPKRFFGASEKDKYQAAIAYTEEAVKAIEKIRRMQEEMLATLRAQIEAVCEEARKIYQQRQDDCDALREAVMEKDRPLEDEINARTEQEIAIRAADLIRRENEITLEQCTALASAVTAAAEAAV